MTKNVFFFVPNFVGYIRILLCSFAIRFWQQPQRFFIFYLLGFLLDALDGYTARVFNQSSQFGALLDMITDRAGTATLLMVLAQLYSGGMNPDVSIPTRGRSWVPSVFLSLMFLDGFSHWLQMGAGFVDDSTKSHKDIGNSKILKFYYKRLVLAFVCLMAELFLLLIYIDYFVQDDESLHYIVPTYFSKPVTISLPIILAICVSPIYIFKQCVSMVQIVSGINILIKHS